MGEFRPIETQEQFDARIADRISRERKTAIEAYAAELKEKGWKSAEDIAALTADLNQQIADLQNAATAAEQTITNQKAEIEANAKYRTDLEKTRIAIAAGLNIDFAERLKGDDAESWKKDAEGLAKMIKAAAPQSTPLRDPDAGGGNGSTRDQFASWFKESFQ